MTIINLTQHAATPEQKAQGVVDVADRQRLQELLTISVSELLADADIEGSMLEDRATDIVVEFVSQEIAKTQRGVILEWVDGGQRGGSDWFTTLHFLKRPKVAAMIGGAPWFMPFLQKELERAGATWHYALSDRVSIEETQEDGTVKKSSVFQHVGFWPPLRDFD